MAKDSEIGERKGAMTPPAPQKFVLTLGSNRLARAISQIRTRYWLSAPYVKRIRKNWEEQVSDK
jgi:hypothetical protein